MWRWSLLSLFALILLALLMWHPSGVRGQGSSVNVLTWHNDNARTGQNLQETILNLQNVNTAQFGKIFSYPVDGQIYAQPLYVSGVVIPGQGTHNVIYVVTENDSAYAFDADSAVSNPNPLWHTSLIQPPTVVPVPCTHGGCNINPQIGITGTPVINLSTNTMYLVARTLETNTQGVGYYYERVHALDITTGAEEPYSPAVICGDYTHTGEGCMFNTQLFNPQQNGQRPGLLLEPQSGFPQGVLYIGFAGHGAMLAYDPQTLTRLADWTAAPTPKLGGGIGGGGIWGSGGAVAGDPQGNVYVSTGDAYFNANTGGNNYGDSLVKLGLVQNGGQYQFQVLDYSTPSDQLCLEDNDFDLGAGGPLLLPPQPGSVTNLAVIAGKGGLVCGPNSILLLNANAMGGLGNPLQTITGAQAGYWSSPAYFSGASANFLYYAGIATDPSKGDYLRQYKLVNGQFNPITAISHSPTVYKVGVTPAISANGKQNAIIWAIERPESYEAETATNPAVLHAYQATNIHVELYNSTMNATRDQAGAATQFVVPTIANGKVYVGTQTELDVYGLCPCPQ